MPGEELGRLERVELREVWGSEPVDFTPWLAEPGNMQLLGDSIGLELATEGIEQPVGPYSADILCRDTATGRYVVIENQLDRTDHSHLGQILTYAAGLDATSVIWLARRFTDEHRAALVWLNNMAGEHLNLFGLEIELWRIGDSVVAPKFNIVAEPNDWVSARQRVHDEKALSEVQRMQLEFWTEFKEYLEESTATLKPTKPLPQHWMTMALGRTGFSLSAVVSTWNSETDAAGHEIRAELVIDGNQSESRFERLLAQNVQIDEEMSEPLTWRSQSGVKMKRAYQRQQVVDLFDRTKWPEYDQWLKEKLEALDRAFRLRIKDIP